MFFFSRDFGRSTRSRWWKSAHWGQVFQTERGNFLQFRFLDGRTQHPKWSLDRSAVEQCRHSLFDLKALGESTKFFSGCTCPSLDECIRIRTNMTFVLNVYLVINHLRLLRQCFVWHLSRPQSVSLFHCKEPQNFNTGGCFQKNCKKGRTM